MDPTPDYDLSAVRARIPLLEHKVPMNAGAQGPQSDATRAAALAYLDSWNRDGMDWEGWIGEVEAARAAFARLIGAEPDEVAVATSVSQAAASLASALGFDGATDDAGTPAATSASQAPARVHAQVRHPARGRPIIVTTEAEFPSVAHVWGAQRARGAELRWVPVRERGAGGSAGGGAGGSAGGGGQGAAGGSGDDGGAGAVDASQIAEAVDARTALVSVTHAWFQNGALVDPGPAVEAAREHGALIFVDAYQSLGTEPLDVKALGVDALASGTMKFLMGTPGIAFLYVRREVAETLEPTVTGWFGRADPFAFDGRNVDWAGGAQRFDTGTPPVVAAAVARAGMELLEEVGLEAIGRWNRVLSERMVEGGLERGLDLMSPRDPSAKTPTTAFRVPDSHAVEHRMMERGVIPSARGPAIRLAPHYYSTLEDVDRALDTLVEVLEEGGG